MSSIALVNLLGTPQAHSIAAEATPCQNCDNQHCKQQQNIACWDYGHYLETGKVRNKRRDPRPDIYRRIMADD